MAHLLEIQQIDQSFRSGFWLTQAQILHDLDFKVPSRSVMGFLGPNGAGKTTLIHLIVGIKKPKRGQILLGGVNVLDPKARCRIGYLPERPYFYEHLTGAELLQYFGSLAGMSRAAIADRTPIVLKSVGMSHARDRELRNYSKGMLQRIGIAQAILHDPEFLVLDEPMSGLDPFGRREIRELIQQLASEGRTIFFSSHIIPDVEAICDHVALIQNGRLIGAGPIAQFLETAAEFVEITFGQVSLESARGLGEWTALRESEGNVCGRLRTSQGVDAVLTGLLAARARILEVKLVRPSLESLFVRQEKQ